MREINESQVTANFAAYELLMQPKYDLLAAQTTRRFVKIHLPIKLLPRNIAEVGAKVVYVARNPKDVAVSYFHLHKSSPGFLYRGDFETFAELFMSDMRE